jgi:hypothetical protein
MYTYIIFKHIYYMYMPRYTHTHTHTHTPRCKCASCAIKEGSSKSTRHFEKSQKNPQKKFQEEDTFFVIGCIA